MTQKQALKLATYKFGKKAAVQDRKRPSSPEARAVASAESKQLRENEPKRPNWLDETEWPDDATIGELRRVTKQFNADYATWRKAKNEALGLALHYRYQVGEITWAFHIHGQGDTWEEALTKAGARVDELCAP